MYGINSSPLPIKVGVIGVATLLADWLSSLLLQLNDKNKTKLKNIFCLLIAVLFLVLKSFNKHHFSCFFKLSRIKGIKINSAWQIELR